MRPTMSNQALIEFALWVAQKEGAPTPATVVRRFRVSRATAYRWLTDYQKASQNLFLLERRQHESVNSFSFMPGVRG